MSNPDNTEREMFFGARPHTHKYARELRKAMTEAEKVLWSRLKQYRKKGMAFRRQHPIDSFVVDFYCHNAKLVIEVDGGIHDDKHVKTSDEGRSHALEDHGLYVIRFNNDKVLKDLDDVMQTIEHWLAALGPHP